MSLADRPRPGRPPIYDLDVHLAIVATVTREPQVDSQWSHRLIAENLARAGIPISASQIGRILAMARRPFDPAEHGLRLFDGRHVHHPLRRGRPARRPVRITGVRPHGREFELPDGCDADGYDRIGWHGSITTHYLAPDGRYLGSENKESRLLILPTDAQTLLSIWKNPNLTRPGGIERPHGSSEPVK